MFGPAGVRFKQVSLYQRVRVNLGKKPPIYRLISHFFPNKKFLGKNIPNFLRGQNQIFGKKVIFPASQSNTLLSLSSRKKYYFSPANMLTCGREFFFGKKLFISHKSQIPLQQRENCYFFPANILTKKIFGKKVFLSFYCTVKPLKTDIP